VKARAVNPEYAGFRSVDTLPLPRLALFLKLWQQTKPFMERVIGIGGVFFRSENPETTARWYQEKLGIDLVPEDYEHQPWTQEAGPTVFAPFPKDTEYFGDRMRMWMLNFRVKNLDAMVEQLRGLGVEVKVDPENYPNGRFARIHDPEGNAIELWEPKEGK